MSGLKTAWRAGLILAGICGLWAGLPARAVAPSQAPVAFIGPEFQVTGGGPETSTGGDRPVAASNPFTNESLVVWENGGAPGMEIYAQRLTAAGNPTGGPVAIATGGTNHIQPAVAYNAVNDEYLVVWAYDASGNGSLYEIWGRRVRGDGTLASNPFQVASNPSLSMRAPRLAWSSGWNQYMLVWEAQSGGSPVEIQMKIMQADGSPVVFSTVSNNDVAPSQPDVTYNSLDGYYLLTWVQVNADFSRSLVGDLRDIAGNRLRPDVFPIFTNPKNINRPRAAFGSGLRYFVAFEFEYSPSDSDVYLAFLDRYAASPAFTIPIAQSGGMETNPQAAAHPERSEVMLAYQSGSSSSSRLILHPFSTGPTDQEIVLCAHSGQSCALPGLVVTPRGSLAVYTAGPPGYWPHIHSREIWQSAIFLPRLSK